MDFGTHDNIIIRYYTDLWGPYLFKFPPCTSSTSNDGAIPYGTTISAVTVNAYSGKVKPSDDLATKTDISSVLIDPSYTPVVVNDTQVSVKFQYPGDSYKGTKATIIFELTLNTSAKHPFYFHYVVIR